MSVLPKICRYVDIYNTVFGKYNYLQHVHLVYKLTKKG